MMAALRIFSDDFFTMLINRRSCASGLLHPCPSLKLKMPPSNKEIAARLKIAEPTVKAHLVHVFEKLGVENRTAAVRVALERGLIGTE